MMVWKRMGFLLASTRSQVSPDINEKTSVEARATSHPERK
jgi:hypothetical protein